MMGDVASLARMYYTIAVYVCQVKKQVFYEKPEKLPFYYFTRCGVGVYEKIPPLTIAESKYPVSTRQTCKRQNLDLPAYKQR